LISLVPNMIPRNLCKKSPDAARTSFTMTVARCLYISYLHDSTLLWDLFDAPTTSHQVLSVCARSFTEINCDATMDMIGVRYATPWPCHVLISWSLDNVISPPRHLVNHAFHIHIIISMQAPCQSLVPSHHFINNLFIILYIILALVLSSKPWRKAQQYLGEYSFSNWSKSTQNSIQFPFEIFLWVH
jgi:hypothetical protein